MKNVKKVIVEMLDMQRYSGADSSKFDTNMVVFLLLGYCSVTELSQDVNLHSILNSGDIKKCTKEALNVIGDKVEDIKGPISYLNNLSLSSEDIAKIIVILKSSLFTADDYRAAFESMLDVMVDIEGKFGGVGSTPQFINKLAVEIIEPFGGEFYDGTFGIGGDAVEAYKFASKLGNKLKVYGQELDIKTYSIAKIRMFIQDIKFADVRIGDVLTNPIFKDEQNGMRKFDSVIMAPPFGLSWKEKESEINEDKYGRFIYGTPGVSSADWLFILTALKSLKENGKGVVITTLGALFRGGAEETLRKKLLGFDFIESVIELSGGLFTNTAIPCAMIVFNMNKPEYLKNKIQFINADDIYESVRRGKNILNDENINFILDIYRNKKEIEDVSIIVDLQDIDNGNISPSKYVIKTKFETQNFGKVKIHLENLNSQRKLENIADFYRGINVTSKNVQDANGRYKIINLADIKDGEVDIDSLPRYTIENNARVEAYKVEAGDIVISNKGATKVCIIPEHEGEVLISQNFLGLRLKGGNNPEYVKEFLESPIGQYLIESRKTGTAVTMINTKDLKELPIACLDAEDQARVIDQYKDEEECLIKEIEALQLKLNNLKLDLYDKMDIKKTFELIKDNV